MICCSLFSCYLEKKIKIKYLNNATLAHILLYEVELPTILCFFETNKRISIITLEFEHDISHSSKVPSNKQRHYMREDPQD